MKSKKTLAHLPSAVLLVPGLGANSKAALHWADTESVGIDGIWYGNSRHQPGSPKARIWRRKVAEDKLGGGKARQRMWGLPDQAPHLHWQPLAFRFCCSLPLWSESLPPWPGRRAPKDLA